MVFADERYRFSSKKHSTLAPWRETEAGHLIPQLISRPFEGPLFYDEYHACRKALILRIGDELATLNGKPIPQFDPAGNAVAQIVEAPKRRSRGVEEALRAVFINLREREVVKATGVPHPMTVVIDRPWTAKDVELTDAG